MVITLNFDFWFLFIGSDKFCFCGLGYIEKPQKADGCTDQLKWSWRDMKPLDHFVVLQGLYTFYTFPLGPLGVEWGR